MTSITYLAKIQDREKMRETLSEMLKLSLDKELALNSYLYAFKTIVPLGDFRSEFIFELKTI